MIKSKIHFLYVDIHKVIDKYVYVMIDMLYRNLVNDNNQICEERKHII